MSGLSPILIVLSILRIVSFLTGTCTKIDDLDEAAKQKWFYQLG